jgi:two-component system chemotaxis sensor kinase CheA
MEIDRAALMEAFLAESEEGLAGMEQALIALEARPDDRDKLQVVFRAAHTLKGSASTMGFRATAEFAHTLEDLLDAVRGRRVPVTADLISLALEAVDVLREMLADLVAGRQETRPQHAVVRASLAARCVAKVAPGGSMTEVAPAPAEESAPLVPAETEWEPALRVGIGKLDQLLGLTGRLSVIQSQAGALLLGGLPDGPDELLEMHRKTERLLLELQDWVIDARMVPIGPTFRSHLRTVRDTAVAQGKRAHLVILGEQVRVDTGVIDSVREALTHMVRNAVHHGIESPRVRESQGKPPEGTVTVQAINDSGRIAIRVSDDGRGFDLIKIRARARSLGLPRVESMSDDELRRLVFEHGFSTAESVTEMSGRGVGMDVVLRSVEALHGTVAIDSQEGIGTTIELRLPFTVSVIEGFWIETASNHFVIPLLDVLECVEMPSGLASPEAREGLLHLRGEPVPVFRLKNLFGLDAVRSEVERGLGWYGETSPVQKAETEQVVIVRGDQRKVGVVVDQLHGERQAVVKPLGRLFREVEGVAGSTLCADGRVALVLDVPGLIRSAQSQRSAAATAV